MSRRREFLAQVAAAAGAASAAKLMAAERLFADSLDRLATHVTGPADPHALKEEYLLAPDVVYLNHASIGTQPRAVHEAHKAYLELCESNPWLYMWGGAWDEPRAQVREKAAGLLGCRPQELAITHNTTEGFNLLASGLPLGRGDEVVFSTLNHPGASICWLHQARSRGFVINRFEFPVEDLPRLSEDEVLDLYDRRISPRTRVLVIPHIDNVVGLRHPVKSLAKLAHERGVEFVAVDGAQSVGMIPVDLHDSGVDFYAASPHKWLQTPKGLGLLYVREEVRDELRPMWVTWGQQRWAGTARVFEDYGTRNLPELLAMSDAMDAQQRLAGLKTRRYPELWESLRARTNETPGVVWRSPSDWSAAGSLCAIEVEGIDSPVFFEKANQAYGLVFRPFQTLGLNVVRISPNTMTTETDIDRFFAAASAAAQPS